MSNTEQSVTESTSSGESELRQIQHALKGLRFGTVTVVVQDGVVVQIERTEKHRVRRRTESAPQITNDKHRHS